MPTPRLEHANITVADPRKTAEGLCDLFGWQIRWEGAAISGGYTVHVGADDSYLAVYAPPSDLEAPLASSYTVPGGLNHIGVVVDDLDATERKVKLAGLTPRNHADYEPGRRFYFDHPDGFEIEVVSYT